MKKFFKFVGIGVLALIILGVVGAMFGEGDDTTTTTAPKTEDVAKQDTTDAEPKAEPKKEEKVAKIGDTLKVGDVEFKITKRTEATNVGGEFGQNAKGKYLILETTVTNRGKEAITIDSSFFKLLADGKEYESDGTASIYANEQVEFLLTQLNPDVSMSGKVVFDIPSDMIGKPLILQVQTGFFGTETGKIELN
jgi:hypothetical protein